MKQARSRIKNTLWIIILLPLAYCHHPGAQPVNEVPVARVGSQYLYAEDLSENFVSGMSEDDSVKFVKNYISRWIKELLLVKKAELYLPVEQQKAVEKQVEETRRNLLVYKYEQDLILQKMDTVVADSLIENFYKEHTDIYDLKENVVKALYIKIPLSAPDLASVRRWYRSNRDGDYTRLESYCYQYAVKFDDFKDRWVPFDLLLDKLPLTINNRERYLRYNPFIEVKDTAYQYFVRINEYKLRGTPAPVEYVSEFIRQVILNERKMKFVRELENNIYMEALSRKEFELYK